MKESIIPFEKTHQFNSFFLDYINRSSKLSDFYSDFPEPAAFSAAIKNKSEFAHRHELVSALKLQYAGLYSEKVFQNISLLVNSNTYTITTGHQLNIATGPLYFVYKILTVIRLCEELKVHYPTFNFVPVYWMASEDHDVAEINHFHLFGKKIEWSSDWKGATGKMPLDGLSSIMSEIPNLPSTFTEAYAHSASLSEATRKLVNSLFGDKGLVILDADNAQLKRIFLPVIQEELQKGTAFQLVENTNESLKAEGYEPQVHVRDVNLFYLFENSRTRITRKGEGIETVDGKFRWTVESVIEEAQQHPERFSPNVVLRPLYQEMILPNLAYSGGPAEVIYWLQLKSLFTHFTTPFPLIIPRNFILYLNKNLNQKREKLGLSFPDLFMDLAYLKKQWLDKNSGKEFSVAEEEEILNRTFAQLAERAKQVDPTLVASVAAEEQKVLKILSELEKKVRKSNERLHEQSLKQLEGLKGKLFPEGSPQERHENILNFIINDPEFISNIYAHIRPLDFNFRIVYED
jgi:bacillithiol biosynthesis cysteine-adding enzyme BshC